MLTDRVEISKRIKKLALRIGFSDCGITPARILPADASYLKKWLRLEMHAGMKYMENHFEKRTDPSQLLPGAKSVIVVLLNYFPKKQQSQDADNLVIAKYAYGADYHIVMKNMLKQFLVAINTEITPCKGRSFVDSAPVLERTLASKAGLGWIGKNTNLISPRLGSFVFLGGLIVDELLEFDKPVADYCGSCTRCIDACPTGALSSPQKLDSRKCISYWTIEHKGKINEMFRGKFNNRIFGCDICQDVCPWNLKVKTTVVKEFEPNPEFLSMKYHEWDTLTESKFNYLFGNSAINRTGYDRLLRNIRFIKKT